MTERRCRAQIRREILRDLRKLARDMIVGWEKEYNERAKMKRKRAHRGADREAMKHVISQDVLPFIQGKDIVHDFTTGLLGSKENIPPPKVMSIPLQDFDMDSL